TALGTATACPSSPPPSSSTGTAACASGTRGCCWRTRCARPSALSPANDRSPLTDSVMIRPMFALALALLLGPTALAQPSFLSDAPIEALGTASPHPDDLFRWTISEP